jgi:DNA-directed RNA polymerase subunit L
MPPLTFEWSDCSAAHVNALRRTIISDIPVLVCKRADCVVEKNTSRFTNEILAERLAAFIPNSVDPAHIDYVVHLNVSNKTKDAIFVTTESLAVTTPAGAAVSGFFPPLEIRTPEGKVVRSHHLLLRLRPEEEVELRCPISRALCGESGQYSATCKSTYWCVRDSVASEAAYEALPEAEKGPERKDDWNKLEANRFVVPGKFMFSVETSSAYTNQEIITTACNIIISKLDGTAAVSQNKASDTAIPNCTDVILRNTDYTIGNLLQHELYAQRDRLGVTFVTFFKHHPHDDHGVLRVATVDETTNVGELLRMTAEPIKRVFFKILQGPGQGVLHKKLQEAFLLFQRVEADEKRRRLRELGVPQNILKATDEEGLDMIAKTYLNRGEQSVKPSLLNVKEGDLSNGEAESPNDGSPKDGDAESPNDGSPKDGDAESPNDASLKDGEADPDAKHPETDNDLKGDESKDAASNEVETKPKKRVAKKKVPETKEDAKEETGPKDAPKKTKTIKKVAQKNETS